MALTRFSADLPTSLAEGQRSLLAAHGIEAQVRPGYLPGVSQLWLDEEQADLARLVLEIGDEEPGGEEVDCPACGAGVPAAFAVCWQCNETLDGGEPVFERPASQPDDRDVGPPSAPSEAPERRTSIWTGVFALLLVVSNGAWFLSREPPIDTPATRTSWDARQGCWVSRWQASSRLSYVTCDHDRNGQPEYWTTYDTRGRKKTVAFDSNQDGVTERYLEYDGSGRLIIEALYDADGVPTERTELHPDGTRSVWTDPDGDEYFETRTRMTDDGMVLFVERDGPDGFERVGP